MTTPADSNEPKLSRGASDVDLEPFFDAAEGGDGGGSGTGFLTQEYLRPLDGNKLGTTVMGTSTPLGSETSSVCSSRMGWTPDHLARSGDSTHGLSSMVSSTKSPPCSVSSLASLSNSSSPVPPAAAAAAETKTPKLSNKNSASKLSSLPSIPSLMDEGQQQQQQDHRIRLGICAMDKKARSKPMAEILSRLDESLFQIVFFGDDMILNQPVEEWPHVDVLIAFHSTGYPLDKAMKYVELHKPFILNDLSMQTTLNDRRRVYDLLEASGIDVPRHVYLSRDGYVSTRSGGGNGNNEQEVVEHDDHIELNGVHIHKPFVEKPVDADDHNIAIYYPTSAGGGCKKLFRKVANRSSEFYADINEVRRDGSYIYEEFVETQGTDVKMYTVGPEYGHAEARKSPTVDGKVERNSAGKEVRFPVILTFREKEIARRVVLGFKQWVCGFDLLRVQEGDSVISYVCDVNGWSFVKNSRKYYDDCAQVLMEHILAAVKPKSLKCLSTLEPLMATTPGGVPESPMKHHVRMLSSTLQKMFHGKPNEVEDNPAVEETKVWTSPKTMEGVGVDGTTGGDITPPRSAATTLEEGAVPVREIPDLLTSEPASMNSSVVGEPASPTNNMPRTSSFQDQHKEELRCCIAIVRHGDRTPKQKLKMNTAEPHILEYFHNHTNNCRKDLKVKLKKPLVEFLQTVKTIIAEKEADPTFKKDILNKLRHTRDVLERWKIAGLNRKLQIKPRKWEEVVNEDGETVLRCTEVQLILKWGGNLTKLGEKQAIQLGQRLRQELYPDAPGGGILRLHSTFRHDLKIKTSDEGRVMKTAAAFAKGLLELEGEIPPILVSLVHKEMDSIHMLDPSGNKDVESELVKCKEKINVSLQRDVDFDKTSVEEHEQIVGPSSLTSLHEALREVGNPRKTLFKIHTLIGELFVQLEEMLGLMTSGDESRNEGEGLKGDHEVDQALSGVKLYKGETLLELTERWRFLHSRLYDEEKDVFDLSRVPDVHDNVRFDMLHNPHLGLTSTLERLYDLAKDMADCVVPQEYGQTVEEKRSIGSKMCSALLEKIKYDLIIAKTDNKSDMRYMINSDYYADLPITTMGRRVRTRLYFTSESHLHTLLNMLRYAASDDSNEILSEKGKLIISGTPELCYLTQIIIRLFEDVRQDADDPRRFRVEIMFSPGATCTPTHMSELERDLDATRFDTDGLEVISLEGLTCDQVETFLGESISAGITEGDEHDVYEIASMDDIVLKKNKKDKKQKDEQLQSNVKSVKEEMADGSPVVQQKSVLRSNKDEDDTKKTLMKEKSVSWVPDNNCGMAPAKAASSTMLSREVPDEQAKQDEVDEETRLKEEEEQERIERMARLLARQYFWKSIAFVSFFMGIGCLFLARNLGESSQYQ